MSRLPSAVRCLAVITTDGDLVAWGDVGRLPETRRGVLVVERLSLYGDAIPTPEQPGRALCKLREGRCSSCVRFRRLSIAAAIGLDGTLLPAAVDAARLPRLAVHQGRLLAVWQRFHTAAHSRGAAAITGHPSGALDRQDVAARPDATPVVDAPPKPAPVPVAAAPRSSARPTR